MIIIHSYQYDMKIHFYISILSYRHLRSFRSCAAEVFWLNFELLSAGSLGTLPFGKTRGSKISEIFGAGGAIKNIGDFWSRGPYLRSGFQRYLSLFVCLQG